MSLSNFAEIKLFHIDASWSIVHSSFNFYVVGVSLIWNIPLRTIVVVSFVRVRHVSVERRKLKLSIWKLSKIRNRYFVLLKDYSVIGQKGKCQSGCFKKRKHAKFSERRPFLTAPPPSPAPDAPGVRVPLLPYYRRIVSWFYN